MYRLEAPRVALRQRPDTGMAEDEEREFSAAVKLSRKIGSDGLAKAPEPTSGLQAERSCDSRSYFTMINEWATRGSQFDHLVGAAATGTAR